MTTFLRFPDEARARACLPGWYDAELGWAVRMFERGPRGLVGAWVPVPGAAIDVLGPIDGQGFHLNVLGDIPAKARPFVVEPTTPRRVFAA